MNLLTVTKGTRNNPGAARPNKPNVTLVPSKDVLTRPMRDSSGVRLVGDYIMNPGGQQMIQIYATSSKQSQSVEGSGDDDNVSLKHKYVCVVPGDEVEINELVQKLLGEDLEIISENCSENYKRVYGTHCAPMKLNPSFTSDKDGRMHTLTFEQTVGTEFMPAFYYGGLSLQQAYGQADENLNLLVANGKQNQLVAFAAAETLTVASIDFAHDEQVSLIGGGGADPATLSSGVAGAVTVLLKDDTPWTALDNATITFAVFAQDATTFLVERSRG